jgi:hypothetical protein
MRFNKGNKIQSQWRVTEVCLTKKMEIRMIHKTRTLLAQKSLKVVFIVL